jgi:uncharacterized membrane protein
MMAADDTTDAERVNFFSDAVIAIAITLLALGLPVPNGRTNAEMWHDLASHLNEYIAFLISFAVIGGHWFAHRRVFGYLATVSGRLARWNMLWLLMIVLTPFATRAIVGDGAFAVRFCIYASVQALAFGFFLLAVREMDRQGLARADTPREVFRRGYYRVSVAMAAFAISIPIAFVTRWAYLCWLAIPLAARAGRVGRAIRSRIRPA